MSQDPFPDREQNGEEPDGFVPSPADGLGAADDGEGPEQGLFVCLPAEELSLEGFAQDGRADTMAPGPLLGVVLEAVAGPGGAGLAGLGDDQLMGVLSGARRMESRVAWLQLAALAELAGEFAADEVAAGFGLSWESAAGLVGYADAVSGRLPRCFAALAGAAAGATFGRLRYAARRLVLRLDPEAARRRKEQAGREAHVRRFREDSGNAGMVARELPCAEVLASWQHVEQRAVELRAAGMPGTLAELRVRACLDLLQERDSRLCPAGPDPAGTAAGDGGRGGNDGPGGPGPGGGGPGPQDGPGGPGGGGSPGPQDGPGGPRPGGPGGPRPGPGANGGNGGGHGRGRPGTRDPGPAVAALVNITVPLSTVQGRSRAPGEAAGFGLLDAGAARDLVAAAARHPDTRWCLTALHPDGTAAAHGCARGRHPPPGTLPCTGPGGGSAGPDPPPGTRSGGGSAGPDPPLGLPPPDQLAGPGIAMIPVARGGCDHARAEAGYRPSRALQHRVRARNTRCTARGCGRPAARCDLDHTLAWDQGGLTCECDLAPPCKR